MEFLSQHKKAFFIFLVLICLLGVLLTLGFKLQPTVFHNTLGYVITPAQKTVTNMTAWLGQKVNFATNISETEKENIRLKEAMETLSEENTRLKRRETELEQLNQLFKLDEKYPDYPKVGARIIAKDVDNWYSNCYNSFLIDKGSRDGLTKNMVVMAQGGLVGRILETWPNSSKVVGLIDVASSISAKSVRTENIGFAKGDLQLGASGLCIMEFIDSSAEILEGDEIVTSHLSEFYPPGLTIGYVKEIKTDRAGLTKHAILQPVVNFKHMETVLVIQQNFHEDHLDILSEAYQKTLEE